AEVVQQREAYEVKLSGGFTRIFPSPDPARQALYEELLRGAVDLFQSSFQAKAKRALDALSDERRRKEEAQHGGDSDSVRADKARAKAHRDRLASLAAERRAKKAAEKSLELTSPGVLTAFSAPTASTATGAVHVLQAGPAPAGAPWAAGNTGGHPQLLYLPAQMSVRLAPGAASGAGYSGAAGQPPPGPVAISFAALINMGPGAVPPGCLPLPSSHPNHPSYPNHLNLPTTMSGAQAGMEQWGGGEEGPGQGWVPLLRPGSFPSSRPQSAHSSVDSAFLRSNGQLQRQQVRSAARRTPPLGVSGEGLGGARLDGGGGGYVLLPGRTAPQQLLHHQLLQYKGSQQQLLASPPQQQQQQQQGSGGLNQQPWQQARPGQQQQQQWVQHQGWGTGKAEDSCAYPHPPSPHSTYQQQQQQPHQQQQQGLSQAQWQPLPSSGQYNTNHGAVAPAGFRLSAAFSRPPGGGTPAGAAAQGWMAAAPTPRPHPQAAAATRPASAMARPSRTLSSTPPPPSSSRAPEQQQQYQKQQQILQQQQQQQQQHPPPVQPPFDPAHQSAAAPLAPPPPPPAPPAPPSPSPYPVPLL
ncbi:hypothetical protein QJQ45_021115, partial [Haematococcus lacustris]